jgi:hypothetical protein
VCGVHTAGIAQQQESIIVAAAKPHLQLKL